VAHESVKKGSSLRIPWVLERLGLWWNLCGKELLRSGAAECPAGRASSGAGDARGASYLRDRVSIFALKREREKEHVNLE
jgi:hypothetical protein